MNTPLVTSKPYLAVLHRLYIQLAKVNVEEIKPITNIQSSDEYVPVEKEVDSSDKKEKELSTKAKTMPEIKQDPKKRNCAPISYANAILWLADNGYPNLIQGSTGSPEVQKILVDKLTKSMKTDNIGTERSDIHDGLANFITSRGYDVEIEYCGKKVNSCGRFQSSSPDLDFIEDGVKGVSNVVLSLNEYEYDPKQRKYIPILSHAVTVANAKRLKPNIMDIEVKDSLGDFKHLRLVYAEDQRVAELLHERGYRGGSNCIKCYKLYDRSEKYPNRILFVPDVVRFKVVNKE